MRYDFRASISASLFLSVAIGFGSGCSKHSSLTSHAEPVGPVAAASQDAIPNATDRFSTEPMAGLSISSITPLLNGDIAVCTGSNDLFIFNASTHANANQTLRRFARGCQVSQFADGTVLLERVSRPATYESRSLHFLNRRDASEIRNVQISRFQMLGNSQVVIETWNRSHTDLQILNASGATEHTFPNSDLQWNPGLTSSFLAIDADHTQSLIRADGSIQWTLQLPASGSLTRRCRLTQLSGGKSVCSVSSQNLSGPANTAELIITYDQNARELGRHSFEFDPHHPYERETIMETRALSDTTFVVLTRKAQGLSRRETMSATVFNMDATVRYQANLTGSIAGSEISLWESGTNTSDYSAADALMFLTVSVREDRSTDEALRAPILYRPHLITSDRAVEISPVAGAYENRYGHNQTFLVQAGSVYAVGLLDNNSAQSHTVVFYDASGNETGRLTGVSSNRSLAMSANYFVTAAESTIEFFDLTGGKISEVQLPRRSIYLPNTDGDNLPQLSNTIQRVSTVRTTGEGITVVGTQSGSVYLMNSSGTILNAIHTGLTMEELRATPAE